MIYCIFWVGRRIYYLDTEILWQNISLQLSLVFTNLDFAWPSLEGIQLFHVGTVMQDVSIQISVSSIVGLREINTADHRTL